uniref:SCP2 domain-containing protein n=1 Tax=Panagrellus redivivus TaxID=6233 RepID=A0A7E4W0T0_PANRE
MGVELLEVTVTKINIIKEGEDQTMALFHTLAKSEVGNTIIRHLQSQFIQHISSNGTVTTLGEAMAKAQGETKIADPPVNRQRSPPPITVDKDLEELLMKIRRCCDESLVAKVGKCYRIVCEDEKGIAADVLVNLKQGAGSATWTALATDCNVDVDVTFCLSKQCLFALVAGEVSPFTAYMNGSVRISGSVADASGLQHLMDRAKELKCI